jgi:hypothetical protein
MESHRISPHLTLQQFKTKQQHPKPCLVLFFPFLGASPKALREYQDLYLSRGHHVLTVHCQLKDFMFPSHARGIAKETLQYLSSDPFPHNVDRFFVHSMSIGAFIYDVVLKEMSGDALTCVQPKIIGQVFDSLTMGGLGNMITGIAQNFSSPLVKSLVTGGSQTYFWLTKKYTVDYYDELVSFFKEVPVRSPVFLF